MSPKSTVPLVNLLAAHEEIADEVSVGFNRVSTAAAFISGPEVEEFEREFAAFCKVNHCVGVANGTDAIELALRAAGMDYDAGVVLPGNTFVATAEAVVRAGGRPVFADVDPQHLLLDPVSVAKAAGPETTAIIPVHLFGQMAPMGELANVASNHGLDLIEDAAQAHGAAQHGTPPGSWGLAAATSFYPGKNLGAYGDAGAVVTNSADIARAVRQLGNHGSDRKYEHVRFGFNSRMDTLQAVVLLAKLRRIAKWNELRREAAARYEELLTGIDEISLPHPAPGNLHVWHLYVIQVARRDHVIRALNENGVQAGIHYPVPVHLQPAFRKYGYASGDLPVTEAAADQILSLPIYPHITAEQQHMVALALQRGLQA